MADIELVIKIPKGLKKDFELEQWTALSCMEMKNALEKATPLPKGHGRIVDENKITKCEQIGLVMKNGNVTPCLITDAPTIIEADKAESEDKE